MLRAQGPVGYLLIVVIIVLSLAAALYFSGLFEAKHSISIDACKEAALNCTTLKISNPMDPCVQCDKECNDSVTGQEIIPNAVKCCKLGRSDKIYNDSMECPAICESGIHCDDPSKKCCINGKCSKSACIEDSECPANECSTGVCEEKGTCNAFCSNKSIDCGPGKTCCSGIGCKTVVCNNDSGCSDFVPPICYLYACAYKDEPCKASCELQKIEGCCSSTVPCLNGSLCIYGKCLKPNLEKAVQEATGTVLNAIASDNPSDYLGSQIADEEPSDWRNYVPLLSKVNGVTIGATSDYNKFVNISKWVSHSRPYGYPSPANEGKSVIRIFESSSGVCLDAAMLTTAMLRAANIPARIIFPASGMFHAYSEAFVDGRWVGVDSTYAPISAPPLIIDSITSPTITKQKTNYAIAYVAFNYSEYSIILLQNVSYVKSAAVERKVYISLTNETWYPGSLTYPDIHFSFVRNNNQYDVDSCFLNFKAPENCSNDFCYEACGYYNCIGRRDLTIVSGTLYLTFSLPGSGRFLGNRTEFYSNMQVPTYFTFTQLRKNGYITTSLLPSAYRFSCKTFGPSVEEFVYADFHIDQNQRFTLTPNLFIRGENTTQQEFDAFVQELSSYPLP